MVKRCSVLSRMACEALDFVQDSAGKCRTDMNRWAWMVALGIGCSSTGWPTLVDVCDIGATFGAPEISRIRDMGNPYVPVVGEIEGAESDGVATPGEMILIEGSGFGKQPTVMV